MARINTPFFLTILLSSILWSCAAPPTPYQRGVMYQQGKDFKNAIESYKLAVAQNPHDIAGLFNMALAYEDMSNTPVARRIYKQILAITPCHIRSRINLANIMVSNGNLDEAYSILMNGGKECKNSPDISYVYCSLGDISSRKGDLDMAMEWTQKAVEADSTNASALFQLGRLYHEQGDLQNALFHLEQAADILPEEFLIHFHLGCIHKINDNSIDAIRELTEALILNPSCIECYHLLGQLYETTGDLVKAAEHFRLVERQNPHYSGIKDDLSRVYHTLHQDYQKKLGVTR